MLSAADGTIDEPADASTAQGVLHGDVRVLRGLLLEVDGRVPQPVTARHDRGGTTFVSLMSSAAADQSSDGQIRLDRRRTVRPGELVEDLTFTSPLAEPVELAVVVTVRGDRTPLATLRSGSAADPGKLDVQRSGPGVAWSAGDLDVRLSAESAAVELVADGTSCRLSWRVLVPAYGVAGVWLRLTVHDRAPVVVAAAGEPLAVTEIVDRLAGPGTDPRLRPWLQWSLVDLNALRMALPGAEGDAFFAAGSPWYLTLFGRDSLWTARLLLPVDLRHAASTLRVLAGRQGTRVDPDSAEQPGKILHELRRAPFAFGDIDLPSVYYGTVDATLLWVCLLHDAWRAGLDDTTVRDLMPACAAALGWLIEHADADGDHFVEYLDTSGHGLSNQGWKDSTDAVRFADGSRAGGPIALVEVQGYAYEAARAGAALLDAFGLPGGERYRCWADDLAERFRASFWCGSGPAAYPALALDGAKRRVDSLTSNIGHLLGTGILSADEERLVASRLASPELDSGLGLRTMASDAGGYWPLSYHCGSVWPHDTAIAIAGLVRAGLGGHAAGLVEGLLRAGVAFDGRLPELWSGEGAAVPYPSACRPQAWSAAAAVTVATALQALSTTAGES